MSSVLNLKAYHALLMAGFQNLPAFLDKKVDGKEARARYRFYRDHLNPTVKQLEDDRLKMLLELSDKDGDKPKKNEDGSFVLSDENLATFRKQYDEMLNEDWNVDVTESNKPDLKVIQAIIEDCDHVEPGLHEKAYNEILDELEEKLA